MFGLFVNLTDRLVVVVGSGEVGLRKVKALRAAGAVVRVVTLEERPDDVEVDVQWLTGPYEAHHLDDAALVIAAGPASVNARVVANARSRGIWACDAANPAAGDFITPASVRRGEVVVAVTTGVPALTKALCERLEEEIEPGWGEWAEILAELRPRILALPAERREVLWVALTAAKWLTRLAESGVVAVRTEMEGLLGED
jgi:siroheme synthase-like protein